MSLWNSTEFKGGRILSDTKVIFVQPAVTKTIIDSQKQS